MQASLFLLKREANSKVGTDTGKAKAPFATKQQRISYNKCDLYMGYANVSK